MMTSEPPINLCKFTYQTLKRCVIFNSCIRLRVEGNKHVSAAVSLRRLATLLFSCVCITLTLGYFFLLERRYDKQSNFAFQAQPKILQSNNSDVNNKTEKEMNGRFIFAFSYWEQVTMATSSLIQLTALAAYGRRQVVFPFVADSSFVGTKVGKNTPTLGAYYNIPEFNDMLRSQGYSTVVSWETFQAICKQTLDVLLVFLYPNMRHSEIKSAFFQCDLQKRKTFHGFKNEKRVCVDAGAFQSFENEVIKDCPCVGIEDWRGSGHPIRTNFDLPPNPPRLKERLANIFNTSLVQIAQDFIAKNLQPGFISIHIRAEKIRHGKDISLIKKYLSELKTNVLQTIATDPSRQIHNLKIFLSSDIAAHGSHSSMMRAARKHGVDLILKEYLGVLNATTFQPDLYKLTDTGSAAIVEMIILRQGKKLFLCGGGAFQGWIKDQFTAWNPRGLKDVYLSCT